MNKFLILISFIFLISCGNKETTFQSSIRPDQNNEKFLVSHKRVKELFVVVFEKDYSAEEWKQVFDLTNILSANKKVLRSIEGQDSEDAGSVRSKLIKENAEILTNLSEKSVFMMSWSAQDENCKIVDKELTSMICRPRNLNNPLNGGLPSITDPLYWVVPNPIKSDTKSPYLKILLSKLTSPENLQSYDIELRLKDESESDSESWFKGEAIPSANSIFLKSDGSLSHQFFKFGYAEMTLGN